MVEPVLLTVTQLNTYIKSLLEGDPNLTSVFVSGEISNFTNHYRSGHFYLSLKDEKSVVKSVMFATYARRLRFLPEDGMKVIARGHIGVYEPTGQYQLYIEDLQPDGVGALNLAFEQLKEKLGAEGLFRPGDSLSRAEAVAMLARLTVDENGQALYQEGESYPVSFSDVDGDSWYASYVGFAQKYNIVGGYEDGTFRPDQPVTRAELMKILAAYFPGETGSASFVDVPETHWAYRAVAFGAGKGFVAGYEDGTFRPDQPVTRAEAVKMINGALGRIPEEGHLAELISRNPFQDVDESHWAYGNILEASVAHNPDGTLA